MDFYHSQELRSSQDGEETIIESSGSRIFRGRAKPANKEDIEQYRSKGAVGFMAFAAPVEPETKKSPLFPSGTGGGVGAGGVEGTEIKKMDSKGLHVMPERDVSEEEFHLGVPGQKSK